MKGINRYKVACEGHQKSIPGKRVPMRKNWCFGVGEGCIHPALFLSTLEPFLPLALDPDGFWLCTVPFRPSPPLQALKISKDGTFHLCCVTSGKLVTPLGLSSPLLNKAVRKFLKVPGVLFGQCLCPTLI